jgi:hypothetical protein
MTIMYVCDPCSVDHSDMCGHFDRNELRVIDGGKWVCESCFEDIAPADSRWSQFPPPPEYVAARLAVPQ